MSVVSREPSRHSAVNITIAKWLVRIAAPAVVLNFLVHVKNLSQDQVGPVSGNQLQKTSSLPKLTTAMAWLGLK